ncbi:TetR family transcriptional regulator [Parafrankia colletiae]|uniref:TetR family transcriptional regulator n=1 Tax=Parafrankia colletiae TaxID=573497 RepID=A0A1S1Q4Z1_9ACTN|nr:TetR/AcrR family transcriptional regulator [Parafrankia colletiae]MCK9903782.1 TetR/AcrR family transcriptional regulator [Frankia sp. Cpl3]OHV28649.1 TetR family transcriptional regulator [Parafrankia colletiae]
MPPGDLADACSRPRRGRPRDATIDDRVLRAAVDELAGHGVGGFSVNSVAARAGVAKRGIYARWATRDALVLAALGTLAAGLVPPRTGSLREDLLRLAPQVDAVFTEPRMSILARCVAELSRYPDLYAAFRRESVDRCAAAVQDAFHDARLRGETRPDLDTDLAASAFLGALLTRQAFGRQAFGRPRGAPDDAAAPDGMTGLGGAANWEVAADREVAAVPTPYHRRLVEFALAAARGSDAATQVSG